MKRQYKFNINFSEYSGGLSALDCSVMAKISDGYTIGAINSCIKEILTCKRKLQLRSKPLSHAELINALRYVPKYKYQISKIKKNSEIKISFHAKQFA